ncbi:hypothetical protein BKA66DRAFT_446706 [Pyrenochaeta sp. MPI-SDFR-AT-0127]|nr:hypothetical protein BKA66DRAFT_446706 [Pyrenochaeta sp. MPI-SDFR-AT-0127]
MPASTRIETKRKRPQYSNNYLRFGDDGRKAELRPYLVGGPQVFVADKKGPYTNAELSTFVAAQYPHQNFWLGEQVYLGVATPKRITIFEEQMDVNAFALKMNERAFEVRFRAVFRGLTCSLCGDSHVTMDCDQTGCTPAVPSVPTKLFIRPAVK